MPSPLAAATPLALAAALSAAWVAAPTPARACGGFFCNATIPVGQTTPIRIVQAGERVLFADLGADGVQMIVEVRYDGDPTEFGWILPIPTPDDGVALEDMLSVSVPEVFEALQAQTEPSFFVAQLTNGPNACSPSESGGFGCGSGDAASSRGGIVEDVGFEPPPEPAGVTIADEARVGPYDARLIQATNADALYTWLGDNGYFQDPAARPLLSHYIAGGWSFIAVRLQNGRDLGDIRPIVLHLGENAPCVPLRLTSIAANDDMPILVWVLGPGRAIPKNFLHAVVNDQALTFPGAPEYMARVTDAIDQASGRAWVTEAAVPARTIAELVSAQVRGQILEAASLSQLQSALQVLGDGPTLRRILIDELAPDASAVADFAQDPLTYMTAEGITIVNGLPTLVGRLDAELVAPLDEVDALIADATTLTRFITTIDPDEMTRDPVFAFNAELPDVSPAHGITVETRTNESCQGFFRVTYPDGRVLTVPASGQTIPPIVGASALRFVQVVDEEGAARSFDPDQAAAVDAALEGATPGFPSLPIGFELDPAPRDPTDPQTGPVDDDGGCRVALPGAFLLLPLAFLVGLARRARRAGAAA